MNIQIQSIQFDADQKLIELIERKVSKLHTYFNNIIDIEVFLKLEKNGSQIKQKETHIKLNLPGKTLFSEESSQAFEESVEMAVDSMRRQLKKHKEKIRN